MQLPAFQGGGKGGGERTPLPVVVVALYSGGRRHDVQLLMGTSAPAVGVQILMPGGVVGPRTTAEARGCIYVTAYYLSADPGANGVTITSMHKQPRTNI